MQHVPSLHNWLSKTNPNTYIPPQAVVRKDLNTGNIVLGKWRKHVNSLYPISQIGSNNYKRAAEEVRSSLAKYFMEENVKDLAVGKSWYNYIKKPIAII